MNKALRFDAHSPRHIRTDTPSTSSSLSRRQPLLQRSLSKTTPKGTCGGSAAAEFCGGTTAECAVVWCCCPCGLFNLFVLAVYKVPAGICRRALRHRRRKRLTKSGLLPQVPESGDSTQKRRRCGCGESESGIHPLGSGDAPDEKDDFLELIITGKIEEEEDEAVTALEKEMWDRFYGAGFWRSPSQRETVSSPRTLETGLLRGPSQRETVVVPSPRASFTGVFRTASLSAATAVASSSPKSVEQ